MMFEYSDLEMTRPYLLQILHANDLKKVERTSLSRLFKAVRRNPKFSIFGDYLILSYSLDVLIEQGAKITEDQIKTALSYSEEYKGNGKKDKMTWYRLLEEQINGVNAPPKRVVKGALKSKKGKKA